MRFLPILIASVTALAAFAQSASQDAKKIRVQFRALSFDEPILGAAFTEGKTTTKLDISPDMFTPEQLYVGSNTINFYKFSTLKETKEELAPEVVESHGRLGALSAKAAALNSDLQKLRDKAASLTVAKGERGGGRMSKQDQDQLDQLYREMDDYAKALAQIDAEVAKEQQILANRAQQAQANRDESAKKKAEDLKKKTVLPAPTKKSGEPAAEQPKPIATCTLPDSGKYILLFFKDGDKHRILAMNDMENTFPYGGILYINLTRKTIQVRYSTKTVELPANGRTVFPPQAAAGEYVRGEILTLGDDGYQIGAAPRTFQQDDVRTLFFVLPVEVENSHVVQLKGIEERKQPDPVPDPNAGAAKGGNKPTAGKAAK